MLHEFVEEMNTKICCIFSNFPYLHISGQIITTGSLVGESFQNRLNSGLGIILICPAISTSLVHHDLCILVTFGQQHHTTVDG